MRRYLVQNNKNNLHQVAVAHRTLLSFTSFHLKCSSDNINKNIIKYIMYILMYILCTYIM